MGENVTIPVELPVYGGSLRAKVPLPDGNVTPEAILPAVYSVSGAVVHLAVMASEGRGKKVSCAKGCGACCRQYVPIPETEAYRLEKLVRDLPEPRRSRVLAAFERVRARLEKEGLLDRVMSSTGLSGPEREDLSRDYFALQEACPFLEDESCSIYPDWPIICREYLVTTPKEWCSTLDPRVENVPLPLGPGTALYWMNAGPDDTHAPLVPLSLLMEWAKDMPAPPPARPAAEVFERFMDRMMERVVRPERPG